MNEPSFWNRFSKVTESRPAKVLRDLTGTVKAGCLVVGVLWVVVCFVMPFLWDVACFLYFSPVWLLLAVPCFIVIAVVVDAIRGGAGGCYSSNDYAGLADYQGQRLSPCSGGIVTSPHDRYDCIRVDPFDDCYRTEPCVGLSYGRDDYVDPFAKLPPCPDILDEYGTIDPAYQSLGCVQLDPCDPCYRPVTC